MPIHRISPARGRASAYLLCAVAAAMLPAVASAAPAAPAPGDTPPVAPSFTARMVIEQQLTAPSRRAGELSGAEASRIRQLQLEGIGQMLEPRREIGGEARSGS